jgi:hypothetical protein
MTRRLRLGVSVGTVVALAAALAVVVPKVTTSAAVTPAVSKVLVVVEENHSLAQMESGMPYAFSQAKAYGYATSWTAITHPSLPNYIAIASGKTYGITDDNAPSSHKLTGPSVFGQARAAGRTARLYAEGETSNCMQGNTGRYAVKHNPWAYFVDSAERAGCSTDDVPFTRLAADVIAGALPNVGMVVPDLCNDAHDCSLATADAWFKALMTKVYAGADWQSGRLVVVLTADEDDKKSGNKVLTAVLHPSLAGKVVTTALTHYSLTRFLEDVAGAAHLNGAATAPDMAAAFGLVPTPSGSATPTPTPTTATPSPTPTVTTTTAAPTTPTPTPATTTATPPPATGEQSAAAKYGWGPVVAGDEFGYVGPPDPVKWNAYNSPGQGGKGLRRPAQIHADGSALTITGTSDGTTGGMSANFDRRKYGRWEARMKVSRDSHYHPVLILWPDGDRTTCPEVDYAESTKDTTLMRFFLHYGCAPNQTTASKAVDMTAWHDYAVEWTPTGITGYVDGVAYFTDTDLSHLPPGSMHQTVQLDWFPDTTATAGSSTMTVDWVRVYNLGTFAPSPSPTPSGCAT